jgi:hypothetical protein
MNGKTYIIDDFFEVGCYFFKRVPSGEYDISVTDVDGYQDKIKTVNLENGEEKNIRFYLQKPKSKFIKNWIPQKIIGNILNLFLEKFQTFINNNLNNI